MPPTLAVWRPCEEPTVIAQYAPAFAQNSDCVGNVLKYVVHQDKVERSLRIGARSELSNVHIATFGSGYFDGFPIKVNAFSMS